MDELASQINDDSTRAFYDYWRSRTRDGKLPRWQEFDPVEMRDWLGWINVIEVMGDADSYRFRYRVHGDRLSDFLGVEMTGKFTDEISTETVREPAQRGNEAVARTAEPTLVRYAATNAFGRPFTVQRLTVPVLDDGDMLLVAYFRIEP